MQLYVCVSRTEQTTNDVHGVRRLSTTHIVFNFSRNEREIAFPFTFTPIHNTPGVV